ncbi:MAG: hypothetical protein FWC67_00805 [Defluviitaleaceae bacterium]|nr:hypothetical protein [Defluviitaleaceae bacterium]
MREHYDFSDAIKNPHAQRLKKGYTIIVEHEDHEEVITISKTTRIKNIASEQRVLNKEEA